MELQIHQLATMRPDGAPALRDVSLTMGVGVCGLLGGAHAGKSTLLRVLAGMQPAAEGSSARLADVDLLAGTEVARRRVGHLPQDLASTCKAGAAEVLNHHAVLKGLPGYQARRDIVEALLRQVGLWEAHREPPGQFPDGMRRRFGLAIALLGCPPLLLLDAPATGLDGDERARMLALVAALGRKHIVLMATRDAADVVAVCSRLVLLDRGVLRLDAALRGGAPGSTERTEPRADQPSGMFGSTTLASCSSDCCQPR